MSELTTCNRCTLEGMRRRNKDPKVVIRCIPDPEHGGYRVWKVDKKTGKRLEDMGAWFMDVTKECCC